MSGRYGSILAGLVVSVVGLCGEATATTYNVSISTAALQGTAAQFAFDLIGNGAQPNAVTVSNFAVPGGSLGGVASTSGTVSGAFPSAVTLTDKFNFFNELLINLTIGTSFSFQYSFTTNVAQPTPTGFSALFVNPANNFQLFPTTDPSGADVLFLHSIDGVSPGGGSLSVYSGLSNGVTVSISETPLPAALPLFTTGAGMIGLLGWRRKRKTQSALAA